MLSPVRLQSERTKTHHPRLHTREDGDMQTAVGHINRKVEAAAVRGDPLALLYRGYYRIATGCFEDLPEAY